MKLQKNTNSLKVFSSAVHNMLLFLYICMLVEFRKILQYEVKPRSVRTLLLLTFYPFDALGWKKIMFELTLFSQGKFSLAHVKSSPFLRHSLISVLAPLGFWRSLQVFYEPFLCYNFSNNILILCVEMKWYKFAEEKVIKSTWNLTEAEKLRSALFCFSW